MKIVALLDTMWGDQVQRAPRFFHINPNNASGKRLYKLTEGHVLVVTNSCPIMVTTANTHGVPDPKWVKSNLAVLGFDLLLVCGAVAKKTYLATHCNYKQVLYIDHPAARRWGTEQMQVTKSAINSMLAR